MIILLVANKYSLESEWHNSSGEVKDVSWRVSVVFGCVPTCVCEVCLCVYRTWTMKRCCTSTLRTDDRLWRKNSSFSSKFTNRSPQRLSRSVAVLQMSRRPASLNCSLIVLATPRLMFIMQHTAMPCKCNALHNHLQRPQARLHTIGQ